MILVFYKNISVTIDTSMCFIMQFNTERTQRAFTFILKRQVTIIGFVSYWDGEVLGVGAKLNSRLRKYIWVGNVFVLFEKLHDRKKSHNHEVIYRKNDSKIIIILYFPLNMCWINYNIILWYFFLVFWRFSNNWLINIFLNLIWI